MKFLLGMIFGVLCAVGIMMFPEAREAVLVKFDQHTQEFSEIARTKTLQNIKSSFLDETVYADIVAQEQVVWADQLTEHDALPLLEPAVVLSTPGVNSAVAESVNEPATEDVVQTPAKSFTPVFHAVWSPFRSERSAMGFASTLSARLNRNFRVVRLAAGRYEVGFDSSSEQELLRVIDSVLEFTSPDASNQQVSL